MNYKDFFRHKAITKNSIKPTLPEGVTKEEYQKGFQLEMASVNDIRVANNLTLRNLKEDTNYYSKINETPVDDYEISDEPEDEKTGKTGTSVIHKPSVENLHGEARRQQGDADDYIRNQVSKEKLPITLKDEDVDEHCGACEDDLGGEEELGNEYDDNGGLPKIGGALAVPHLGQPIMMGKIIQVGNELGNGPASGELSGMTNAKGVAKDQGGLPVQPQNDKEPITAGGKKLDTSIASKSVGGSVVPGEGQKQGGPNSQGTIASTNKLSESKNKVRLIVKEVLKEIKFDKKSGKWIKINENSVDMKMGPSYKVVQPRQYKTSEDDFARTNQYEPEITEMYDDEEECMMNERYVELANQQRNLSEAELTELKTLREKIDNMALSKRNFGLSQGGVEPSLYEKTDKWIQKAVNPKHKGYCTPMSKPTCTPKRKALAKRFKSGDLSESDYSNELKMCENRCEDWPCCGHGDDCPGRDAHGNEVWSCTGCGRPLPKGAPSSICPKCQRRMSQLDREDPTGQDFEREFGSGEYQMEETVDMKMGPSYKVAQPTLAKTSDDDFARKNQYDPEISEAGGQSVQHRSYRTIDDVPQNSKARWSDEVDEGKVSKVVKTIKKGQKPKSSTKVQDLKHQKPKKTSTGVHKRKP